MKAVILGGAGAQAMFTVRELVRTDVFDEIVIADINLANAEKAAGEIASPKICVQQVDVLDKSGLANAITDADVVVNCTGPYALLCPPIMEVVLEVGTNYIDYCDDIVAHEAIFTPENMSIAEEKGISVLVGVGCSPGLAPLIVMHAASYMDEVDDVKFPQLISNSEPEGPGVVYHLIDNFMGDVPAIRNGVRIAEQAFEREEEWDFGEPLGKAKVSTFGHPEIFTLPRVLPGLKNLSIQLGTYPPENYELLKLLSQIGMASTEPMDVKGQQVVPRDFLIAMLMAQPHDDAGEKVVSGMIVSVKGRKDGHTVTYELHTQANMGPATGIPCAIGAEMIAQGKIKPGMVTPEESIDPRPFIDEWLVRARAISTVKATEKITTRAGVQVTDW